MAGRLFERELHRLLRRCQLFFLILGQGFEIMSQVQAWIALQQAVDLGIGLICLAKGEKHRGVPGLRGEIATVTVNSLLKGCQRLLLFARLEEQLPFQRPAIPIVRVNREHLIEQPGRPIPVLVLIGDACLAKQGFGRVGV